MKVGLLKSGLGWVGTVERLLLDPSSKTANPVSRSQDKSETAQKGAPVTKESKEEFNGPDTSSLTAFLLSLLSCSEAGVRCADDIQSTDDYHEVAEAPAEASTSEGKPRVRKPQSAVVENMEAGGSSNNRGRTLREDPEEGEWQLVSEQDLEMEATVGFVPGQKHRPFVPPEQLPGMSEASVLLTDDFRSFIYSALPTLAQGRTWVLLYSTRIHGMSLLTLYRRTHVLESPYLLVAADSEGTVFGGLLPATLDPTPKRKYQGSSESFVFTNVSDRPKVFRPTGMNRYFVLCTNESLAFGGGGHFALNLDSELLNGSSGSCDTYGSYCLASSEEFTLKDVELWGFAHTSKYTPRQLSFKEPPEAPGVCR
eukprot:TRINITY_DN86_c0_g2_i1.p1 TRINITY_DN86_c0_g2~~TRINITY_DN86_c0_g2_i1.p1  ORF type:complete len:368 (-),score=63.36 TRINITY_DN86_c0_g2_i1:750-1853(-)